MAAGLGRSVLALLAVACRGERGRGFVVVTIQRTGSTWLADELDVHPCIVSGEELFLNGKSGPAPFVWSDSWKHKALEALFSDGSAVEFTLNATVNSLKVLKRCRAAREARGGVACGFKWMMSQHIDRVWGTWLPELCAKHDLGLVFLERLNALRVHASTVARYLASNRTTGGHWSTPKGVAPKQASLDLTTGQTLLSKLDFIERRYAQLRDIRENATARGVRTLSVTYEDIQADRSTGLDRVAKFVLGGDDACAADGFAFTGTASAQKQIHPGELATYVANWDAVVDTLRNSRFRCYLDEDLATMRACLRDRQDPHLSRAAQARTLDSNSARLVLASNFEG